MKTFLITFLVSAAASVCLWQFGLGSRIWPSHPFLAALGTAVAAGIAVQVVFTQINAAQRSKN